MWNRGGCLDCVPRCKRRASQGTRGRFVAAVTLGIAASVFEGLAFTKASAVAYPEAHAWTAFMLYGVMLAAFELSPLPFALGTLELVWLALVSGTTILLPGLIAVEAYRLFRGLPLLLLMLFYLPRYKMSVADLFDTRLAIVLARTRRRAAIKLITVPAQGRCCRSSFPLTTNQRGCLATCRMFSHMPPP